MRGIRYALAGAGAVAVLAAMSPTATAATVTPSVGITCETGKSGNKPYSYCSGGGTAEDHRIVYQCRSSSGNVSGWMRGPWADQGKKSWGQNCGSVMQSGGIYKMKVEQRP